MRRTLTLLTVALLAPLAACGDDSDSAPSSTAAPTAPAAADDVVLRYEVNGGCQMMGPNCATYVVYRSGTVEVFRTGENAPVEVTTEVPEDLVTAWLDAVGTTDVDALAATLPPGTCNACVDGVDVILELNLPSGESTLDSTVVEFSPTEPFFQALDVLMADVFTAGELPIIQR